MTPRPYLGDIEACANEAWRFHGCRGDVWPSTYIRLADEFLRLVDFAPNARVAGTSRRGMQWRRTYLLALQLSESARRPVRYRVREDGIPEIEGLTKDFDPRSAYTAEWKSAFQEEETP